jgi:hypothetical protein
LSSKHSGGCMLQSGRHMRSTEVRSWSVVQAGVVYMGRELQFFYPRFVFV